MIETIRAVKPYRRLEWVGRWPILSDVITLTGHQLRRIVRSGGCLLIALLVLAGALAGSSGRDAQVCVCTAGITIEHAGEACCDEGDDGDSGHAQVRAPCTACHFIPMPDSAAVSSQALAAPVIAVPEPARIPVAIIVWPAVASAPLRFDQRHPPPQGHLRLLRTVVITC